MGADGRLAFGNRDSTLSLGFSSQGEGETWAMVASTPFTEEQTHDLGRGVRHARLDHGCRSPPDGHGYVRHGASEQCAVVSQAIPSSSLPSDELKSTEAFWVRPPEA